MQGGAGPPFRNPPLSGTSGAPAAPPFGSGGGVWRTREDGLNRSCGAHSYPPLLGLSPPCGKGWGQAGAPEGLRLVAEVGPQPALDLGLGHPLAAGVVLDLVAADLADREVARLGVAEVEAGDRGGRGHGEGLRQ